jgi:putative SOS response-associated peptidase YedK
MCVRYTLHKTDAALNAISRALGVPLETPDWAADPKYNVSLTSTMPVVALGEGRPEVRPMRWGLVPANERSNPRPRLLANARSETVASLSAFKKGTAARRCLVPANGFYEWKTLGTLKLPYLFTLAGEEPFAFAGIWDPPGDNLPETYCLLTTEPNSLVGQVHNRMPVLLTAETMPRWIGDKPLPEEELNLIFRPLDPALMASRPVSRFVSSTRNQGPECLEPPREEPREPELDFG